MSETKSDGFWSSRPPKSGEWFCGIVHFNDGRSGVAFVGDFVALPLFATLLIAIGVAIGVYLP